MRIMTCNLRYAGAQDGPNNWEYRAKACVQVIAAQCPDLLCVQEMWPIQGQAIQAGLKQIGSYKAIGYPKTAYDDLEPNTIFYRQDCFERLNNGGYWLSETPHIPGSRSWDSADIRLLTWARLRYCPQDWEFRVLNTHLDHISQRARLQQTQMILADTQAYPESIPHLLLGDFNADYTNPLFQPFWRAGWVDVCAQHLGEAAQQSTFNGFGAETPQRHLGRIDWILTRGPIQSTQAAIIQEMPQGCYPSDHWFVVAEVEPITLVP
jgi:endonuclease/exonuclease/phosphatase family metal-dependent hydrolase